MELYQTKDNETKTIIISRYNMFVVGTGHGGLISVFSTGTELIAIPFMKFIGPKIVVDFNEGRQNQSGCSRPNLQKQCEAWNMVNKITEEVSASSRSDSMLNCLAQKQY
jgi:hypothetical protein